MSIDDKAIPSEEAFQTALGELLERAHRNGITLERAWVCQTDEGKPAWEVDIARVAERDLTDAADLEDELSEGN